MPIRMEIYKLNRLLIHQEEFKFQHIRIMTETDV